MTAELIGIGGLSLATDFLIRLKKHDSSSINIEILLGIDRGCLDLAKQQVTMLEALGFIQIEQKRV